MTGRVAVRAQHGDSGHELGVSIQELPVIAGQVEILPVVERREERCGVMRVRVLVTLHDQPRLGKELRAARVIVVQMGDDDGVDVVGPKAEGIEPVDEQVVVGEAGQGIGVRQAGHGAWRQAGVEQDHRVAGADRVARDGNRDALARVRPVEQERALGADEAVLQGMKRLDGHRADSSTRFRRVPAAQPRSLLVVRSDGTAQLRVRLRGREARNDAVERRDLCCDFNTLPRLDIAAANLARELPRARPAVRSERER